MSDPETVTDGRNHKQLRLVSYGMVASGIATLLVAAVSTRPRGIVIFGLGGLAVAALVFERTQGGAIGISLGFLIGSLAAWVWSTGNGGNYYALGGLLIVAGVINTVLLPPFYRLGERLGDR